MKKKSAIALFACAAFAAAAQQLKVEDQVRLRRAAYDMMGYGFGDLAAAAPTWRAALLLGLCAAFVYWLVVVFPRG